MARSIVLSNGELCIALDDRAQVRDIYYPHVGLEDHVRGHYIHRVGVWVDGAMSWMGEDSSWEISISCEEEALASRIVARNPRIEVELVFKDIVYNERAVFLRRVSVHNKAQRQREIKLYFAHQFEIYKSHGGDTAYYDPSSHSIIHYKGLRVFLINAALDGEPFGDYTAGKANFQGSEGSHRDADDGMLTKNPIEHGPADSVIGLYAQYEPDQERSCHYWIAVANTIPEARELNQYVVKKTPEHLIQSASDYWKAWVNAYQWNFHGLTPPHVALFRRSLMYLRAHIDKEGGVVASLDSDMLQHGLDTYSYVWPRDGAYAALALDLAGDANVSKRFFEFCHSVITDEGYFMHKYLPDRSLGSSWHPWIKDGQVQLPIQEDETASVLFALYCHYLHSRDLEFLEDMYGKLVERAADFLVHYRDPDTKLPRPSYDLWELSRGTFTYTAASVYGALIAAAELSKILGKSSNEAQYRDAAHEVQEAIMKYCWDEGAGAFAKMVRVKDGVLERDNTTDISSAYGIFFYEVLPSTDPRLMRAFDQAVRKLSWGISTGGLARVENDWYYRQGGEATGNPWLISTLWYAEYLIANAHSEADLDRVREIFSWVVRRALPSGVLPEQAHPTTGEPLSAMPLAWSHAAYVTAVLKYLDKLEELGICKACNPAP